MNLRYTLREGREGGGGGGGEERGQGGRWGEGEERGTGEGEKRIRVGGMDGEA